MGRPLVDEATGDAEELERRNEEGGDDQDAPIDEAGDGEGDDEDDEDADEEDDEEEDDEFRDTFQDLEQEWMDPSEDGVLS